MHRAKMFLQCLILFLVLRLCASADTITPAQPLRDGDVLLSKGASFVLGFFSPGNPNRRRYVGIWYNNVSEKTVVWVLNRDHPINDTSGVLSIDAGGNLVLYHRDSPLWSSNFSASSVSSVKDTVAQLLDTGNLVLVQNDGKRVVWQGFDHPTDTMLPYMKLGLDRRTGLNWFLTSWKSPDDPGTGEYSCKMEVNASPQLLLSKGSERIWRSGLLPKMPSVSIVNSSFWNTKDEILMNFTILDASIFSHMKVDAEGRIQRYAWDESTRRWVEFWSAPRHHCDEYGRCGPNSSCDVNGRDDFECTCLAGFEPKSPRDWSLTDTSGGCVRIQGANSCRSGEGFIKMAGMKAPDTLAARVDKGLSMEDCRTRCLNNCNCSAYTSPDVGVGQRGCLSWYGDLMDIGLDAQYGQDLFVRVDAITLAKNERRITFFQKKRMRVILGAGVALIMVFIVSSSWFIMKKRKDKKRQWKMLFNSNSNAIWPKHYSKAKKLNESGANSELQFIDLSIIVAATNNFSPINKLGRGGFGSVYKGILSSGQEIAVKRLSKDSGQGVEEFKNEVTLIARLQHRNLVKLLGCCIEEEEKMLIYEYLPNKSLDSFIFDETKRSTLTWRKRLEIIIGIARGILYLHEDSRLRIIHRDLKASNVLLDVEMIPKISDFGMARLFAGNQIEGRTKRVVGTYGYMSPEYAMQGLFSIKSDVYSFGVLLLEIIAGRRNTTYYHDNPSLNLVGYVWDLWREGKAMGIIDPLLKNAYPTDEVLKYIHIGLLCVQECAIDRPTMLSIMSMFGNNSTLPSPKQPAFILNTCPNGKEPSTYGVGACSINEITITMVEVR